MKLSEGICQDRELAKNDAVVWYYDEKVLRSLEYQDGTWYLVGYLSITSATGLDFPKSSFYFGNIEYVNPPPIVYALFDKNTDESQWEKAYIEFSVHFSRCALQEICEVIKLCRCQQQSQCLNFIH